MQPLAAHAAMQWCMDCHRSFEFDRYPFDDIPEYETYYEVSEELSVYFAADITHGMEVSEVRVEFRAEDDAFDQP